MFPIWISQTRYISLHMLCCVCAALHLFASHSINTHANTWLEIKSQKSNLAEQMMFNPAGFQYGFVVAYNIYCFNIISTFPTYLKATADYKIFIMS